MTWTTAEVGDAAARGCCQTGPMLLRRIGPPRIRPGRPVPAPGAVPVRSAGTPTDETVLDRSLPKAPAALAPSLRSICATFACNSYPGSSWYLGRVPNPACSRRRTTERRMLMMMLTPTASMRLSIHDGRVSRHSPCFHYLGDIRRSGYDPSRIYHTRIAERKREQPSVADVHDIMYIPG